METWLCCPRSNGQGRFATVYNTLHQFTEAGLLRQVAIDSSRSYFDTNNTEHHHYYLEDRHELMDNLLSLLARPTPKALTSTSSLCAQSSSASRFTAGGRRDKQNLSASIA